MKKTIRLLLIVLSIVLMFTGIGFISYGFYMDREISSNINQSKDSYKEELVSPEDSLTESEKKANIEGSNDAQETVMDKDNRGLIVGKVSIPSIDLSLPIYKGEYNSQGVDNMLYGAITNKENQQMGFRNYVLSSHITSNPNLLFSSLIKTNKDDLIYLADKNNLYTYIITDKKQVEPSDTWILDDIDGKATITLYTCYYVGGYDINGHRKTDRTVVFGDFVEAVPLTDSLSEEYFGF